MQVISDKVDADLFVLSLQMSNRNQDRILRAGQTDHLPKMVTYLLQPGREGEHVMNELAESPVGIFNQQFGP